MLDVLVKYYVSLLIFQYSLKPKARAHIEQLVKPLLMDRLAEAVRDAFSIDTATGVQLDVIGKYIGASRQGYTPRGPVTLSDDDFRIVLKLVRIRNTGDSSLYTIQNLLAANFGSKILVSDNQTMQLNYTITDDLGSSDLRDFLVYGKFLPKPMGVQVAVAVIPAHSNNFFGMRTYALPGFNVSPLNSYAFYQTTYPFLSYQGVISV